MNFIEALQEKVKQKLNETLHALDATQAYDLSKVVLESPKEKTHGDFATNAAMVLAKGLGMSPQKLATYFIEKLKELPEIKEASIAGPGFINLSLKEEVWYDMLPKIYSQGASYGKSLAFKGKTANVEYVSVNPTGPLHTGHGRNAVLGDAIASLLHAVGYTVTKEYYVNDAGGQVDHLARSVYLRYEQELGKTVTEQDFSKDMYRGDYLIPVGKALAEKYKDQFLNQPESVWLEMFKTEAVAHMMIPIKEDLKSLGVDMDIYTSEKGLWDKKLIEKTVETLTQKGAIYQGILEAPKGHTLEDWEPREQKLFKSTAYGDDKDRSVQKSDGSWTYFAGDLAYHYDKLQRGYDSLVNVFGADHAGYLKRLKAAVKALSDDTVDLEICVCQMVNFVDKGAPVRMSKRAGTFIRLKDLIDRVGKDATRFLLLTRRHDVSIDFDFEKAVEQSKDNPLFYVQYAHARINSVYKHALETFSDLKEEDLKEAKSGLLKDVSEHEIIKLVSKWPSIIEQAAKAREPHRITAFLQELAGSFHALWNKGRDNVDLRFIAPKDKDLSLARLLLLKTLALVLASGLTLLGIEPVDEMH